MNWNRTALLLFLLWSASTWGQSNKTYFIDLSNVNDYNLNPPPTPNGRSLPQFNHTTPDGILTVDASAGYPVLYACMIPDIGVSNWGFKCDPKAYPIPFPPGAIYLEISTSDRSSSVLDVALNLNPFLLSPDLSTILYVQIGGDGAQTCTSSAGVFIPIGNNAFYFDTVNPSEVDVHCTSPIVGIFAQNDGGSIALIQNAQVTVSHESSLHLSLSLSKSTVYPDKAGGDNTVIVTARLNSDSGEDVSGKVLNFIATPQQNSGGHNHGGQRPVGTFDNSSCVIEAGTCSVVFSASEFGGTETISASVDDDQSLQASEDLTVQVPNLVNLDDGPQALFGVLSTTIYNLIGSLDDHPSNHWLDPSTQVRIFGVAYDFYNELHGKLQLNDMSLKQGGFFDIGPHIPPSRGGPFPYWTGPSHSLHRVGHSVDVNRCAISVIPNNPHQGSCPPGWVEVPQLDEFEDLCHRWGGFIVNEGPIHCQFSERGQQ